jgi:regulatory protein
MKITAITQQEKLKNRYSIFVDEKYAFSLSDVALLDAKLFAGQELTEVELKGYKELSADDKMYGLVLRYVAIRQRSEWEIETYLQRKQCPVPLQEKILKKLHANRLIDDSVFAEAWVSNRRLLKPVSKRRLQLELTQKHVSHEIIEQVLAEDETNEGDVLKELITRKRKQTKYQDNEKLMAYLARQGFGYGDIKSALNELAEEA